MPAFITDTANKIKGVFNRQDQLGGFGEIDDVSNNEAYENLTHEMKNLKFSDSFMIS